jgi:hypothetical protein
LGKPGGWPLGRSGKRLKFVASDASAPKVGASGEANAGKKNGVYELVNEYFEPAFNAAMASAAEFQMAARL